MSRFPRKVPLVPEPGRRMLREAGQLARVMRDTFYNEDARLAAVARAERWTARQAARLDTSPETILEAIRRAWLPEDIEGVSSKYRLEDHYGPAFSTYVRSVRLAPQDPDEHKDRDQDDIEGKGWSHDRFSGETAAPNGDQA